MEWKRALKIIVISIVIIASVIIIADEVQYRFGIGDYSDDADFGVSNTFADDGCNVAGVLVRGNLFTYYDLDSQSVDDVTTSEDIVYLLELAENTPNIKAILLEIDSYGGSPVAAHEVVDTIKNYVSIPVVAEIREAGLSAAYWVASSADYVFATELSDVGSIGVTQSYVDEGITNQREGYSYNTLNTGKFKDILDPQKTLTWEERQLLQRDLNITHEVFVNDVAENRWMDIEVVRALADGSSMLGQMALEKGLIDEVGGFYEVQDFLTELIEEDAVVCW